MSVSDVIIRKGNTRRYSVRTSCECSNWRWVGFL